ncbi:fibronectin type III domain-containing protein, partial [bacterium]|nr:fibronectin type III domain-containing protein [bacterium]
IVCETIPPNDIPNLTAQTGTEQGEITLSWTAPGDDGTTGNNTEDAYYIVKYATFSCESVGGTAIWWSHGSVNTYAQTWAVGAQGSSEQYDIGGLTPSQTYYIAIKTVDNCLNSSDIDDNAALEATQAQAAAASTAPIPPAAITDLVASAGSALGTVNLQWTAPGDDGAGGGNCSGYEVRYSTSGQITTANYNSASIYAPASSWVPVNFGSSENRTLSGFLPGTTYWFAIKAYDGSSNYGSWSSVPYPGEENKATTSGGTYYVNSNAPDDSGVPNSDPDVLDNCWKTIGQAYADLCTNESNDLTDKGEFVIQIQNSADYVEGLTLAGLTSTSNDTLTIRAVSGERPVWKNDTSTILFCNLDSQNSYGALKIAIQYVTIQGITFTGTKHHGIQTTADYITIRNCIFRDLTVSGSPSNYNHNSHAIYNYGSYHDFYNNTFYNVIYCIGWGGEPGIFTARNNIFYITDCSVDTEIGFLSCGDFADGKPDSDYNIFQIAPGNLLAYDWGFCDGGANSYATLGNWQAWPITPLPDQNSLSGDPKFVNPGTDFHLKSIYGHWTTGG